ncbi:MAG: UvrD-helicase domain-containing protein, partial [Acidimicrobiales bacterium]|nr:UvrD-helicase domain-containing protein [Acidimicrobiales bacterium]
MGAVPRRPRPRGVPRPRRSAGARRACGSAVVTYVPPDQDARTTIAERLDQTLFVEAGAGSGKSTALVGRVLELVATG